MEKLYKLVIENTTSGKIPKDIAVQLLKELKKTEVSHEEIAVVGMALQFPSAATPDQFWQNIRGGVDSIREFPPSRQADIDRYLQYTQAFGADYQYADGAYLESIDGFDYEFFRLTPKEASLMDPCQRLFMQTAWQAFEDAGYGGDKLVGSNTGVYVGFATTVKDAYQKMILDVEPTSLPLSVAGNLPAIIPSRLSYHLNLKGPTLTVDTACSSGLLAVHLACQGILNGDCEQALVGGIKLHLVPLADDNLKTGTEASDGKTRAFDGTSDGAGMGEGAAAVFLKPLSKALKDRDHIYAVIKGSATNQDGRSMGITAPNPVAQTDVIAKAWDKAGVHPESLGCIITHGTGTKLGDPIEIDGLQKAFRRYTDKKQFCAIASVKPNIGHLYECAGLANLITGILALHHQTLPPSLHFQKPNREIGFEQSPVYVNTAPRPWAKGETPRRCGVSSFGFSGTNVHLVLEEAPELTETEQAEESQDGLSIFTLSARSEASLGQLVQRYRDYLAVHRTLPLEAVCYTANTGRGQYKHRLALLCRDTEELLAKLALAADNGLLAQEQAGIFVNAAQPAEGEKLKLSQQAQGLLEQGAALDAIARLYVQGADLNWEPHYRQEGLRKVSLPAYAFDAKRCWIQIPEVRPQLQPLAEEMFYGLNWTPAPLPAGEPQLDDGDVLILLDEAGIGAELAHMYRELGRRTVEVRICNAYAELGDDRYEVSGTEADFVRLLQAQVTGRRLTRILHLAAIGGGVATPEALDDSQTRGAYSLFHLTRALLQTGLQEEIDLVLLGQNVHRVTGQEQTLHPEQAPLFGLARVVRLEHPELKCRCLDFDEAATAAMLLTELHRGEAAPFAAYRQGVRYVTEFGRRALPEATAPLAIREQGVYLITGGTGGIGLAIAAHLASEQRVRLAFVNRSPLPPRAEWDAVLADGADGKAARAIQAIRALEAQGSEVLTYSADVADVVQMQQVTDDLRARFGKIDGVIHGAGLAGNEPLATRRTEDMQAVMSPKVSGTWTLDRVTQADELDFFVLFSSVATLLAGPGQGDYVAANAYLDAFAALRNKQGKRTLTVNWATWKETGMAKDSGFNIDTIFKAMPTAQAVKAFAEALNSGVENVLIGELNVDNPMIHLLEKSAFKLSAELSGQLRTLKAAKTKQKQAAAPAQSGTALAGAPDGDQSIERQIAEVLGAVLGYEEIHLHDNFFELGADSVLLKRVHVELDKRFPGQLGIADLFEKPTIAKLSGYLRDSGLGEPKQVKPKPQADVKQELSDLIDNMMDGSLSLDEVAAALDEF